jgi:hypothetical protein
VLNVFDGESEFHFKQYSSFQCTVNTGNFRNFDNDTKCQKNILVRHQNDKLHRNNASKMTKRKTYYCFIPFCLLSDENLKEETKVLYGRNVSKNVRLLKTIFLTFYRRQKPTKTKLFQLNFLPVTICRHFSFEIECF